MFCEAKEDAFCNDIYVAVLAKSIKPTKNEIKKYAATDEDDSGITEMCRLNLTKWKILDVDKYAMKFCKHLIGKIVWAYYNGNECAWKFYDPDGDYDKKNNGLYVCKGKPTLSQIDKITSYHPIGLYEPHNDHDKNYGDESVHAVYEISCSDTLKTKENKYNTFTVKDLLKYIKDKNIPMNAEIAFCGNGDGAFYEVTECIGYNEDKNQLEIDY